MISHNCNANSQLLYSAPWPMKSSIYKTFSPSYSSVSWFSGTMNLHPNISLWMNTLRSLTIIVCVLPLFDILKYILNFAGHQIKSKLFGWFLAYVPICPVKSTTIKTISEISYEVKTYFLYVYRALVFYWIIRTGYCTWSHKHLTWKLDFIIRRLHKILMPRISFDFSFKLQ